MNTRILLRLPLAILAALAVTASAAAQTAPSASEVAAYRGLHAAAAKGDLTSLRKALQAKEDVNGRDGHGRTALHVAAHGSQREIISLMRRPHRSGFTIRRKVWSLAPFEGVGKANRKSGCGPGMPVG